MGNNQSNGIYNFTGKPNYKIYKITGKSFSGNGYDRFYLDDYVTYKNGNYRYIDLDTNLIFRLQRRIGFLEGTYCKIDQEITRRESSSYNFEEYYTLSIVDERTIIERRDSNGNI